MSAMIQKAVEGLSGMTHIYKETQDWCVGDLERYFPDSTLEERTEAVEKAMEVIKFYNQ